MTTPTLGSNTVPCHNTDYFATTSNTISLCSLVEQNVLHRWQVLCSTISFCSIVYICYIFIFIFIQSGNEFSQSIMTLRSLAYCEAIAIFILSIDQMDANKTPFANCAKWYQNQFKCIAFTLSSNTQYFVTTLLSNTILLRSIVSLVLLHYLASLESGLRVSIQFDLPTTFWRYLIVHLRNYYTFAKDG